MKKSIIALAVIGTVLSGAAFANTQQVNEQEEAKFFQLENLELFTGLASSSKNLKVSSTLNAGGGDYSETHDIELDNTLLTVGVGIPVGDSVYLKGNIGFPVGSSADYGFDSCQAGCNDISASPDTSGLEGEVTAYWNVSPYSAAYFQADLYVVAGMEFASYESDAFNNADRRREFEFSDRQIKLGLAASSVISQDIHWMLGANVISGSTEADISSVTTSGFTVSESANLEGDYIGYEFDLGVRVTKGDWAFGGGYKHMSTFSESWSFDQRLSVVNNVDSSGEDGEYSTDKFYFEVAYMFGQ